MDLEDKFLEEEALENAKKLVASLESGDTQSAKRLMDHMAQPRRDSMFIQIGRLTRDLHRALNDFQLDSRIADLAAQDIPDAKERLAYVITMTEQAANRTMDAVEKSLPMADGIQTGVEQLIPDWQRLMRKELQPGEFREMCKRMEDFLNDTQQNSGRMHSLLTEVLMAQDYQDLTGQIIRRVISLVHDVEESLVSTIRMFGTMDEYNDALARGAKLTSEPEGPVIHPEKRDDVVQGQDDVDDLLSSLGF